MKQESELMKLGDLIDIKHGYGFKGEYFTDLPTKNILLTPGNFRIGGGFTDNKKKFYDGPVDHEYILNPGDLIITMTDLSKNGDTLGFPAIVPKTKGNEIFLHNQRLGKVILKRNEKILKKYLYYLLTTKNYQKTIVSSATGTTVKHTSPTRILEYEFLLPPIKTQQNIANILSSLDDKIELNRQMNQTLESMARTIFKSWFVDFDPVYAKMEGRDYPLPPEIMDLFPDELEESELGLIPKGWRVETVGDIADNPKKVVHPNEVTEATYYIGLEHMSRRNISLDTWDYSEKVTSNKYSFSKGNILFGKLRPYFHKVGIAPIDGICSTDIIVVNGKDEIFQHYLLFLMSSAEFVDNVSAASTGTKMPRTDWKYIQSYEIPLPPEIILMKFDSIVEPMVEKISLNIHESKSLEKLREVVMPKLMSGELNV